MDKYSGIEEYIREAGKAQADCDAVGLDWGQWAAENPARIRQLELLRQAAQADARALDEAMAAETDPLKRAEIARVRTKLISAGFETVSQLIRAGIQEASVVYCKGAADMLALIAMLRP